MIGLSIDDQKMFTRLLFLSDTFDSFELAEGEFITRFSTTIDGAVSGPEGNTGFVTWGEVRNIAFQIIKGRQLPRAFRLTFRLSLKNMERTLASIGKTAEDTGITSLLFNIRYEHGELMLITGCSYRSFSLDRTAEREWDEMMMRFLLKHEVPYVKV